MSIFFGCYLKITMMIMIRTIFITILITTIATYYCDGDGDLRTARRRQGVLPKS